MSALAKAIRAHVTDGLRAAGTAAGARVFAARHRALQPDELPALLVYTDRENVLESRFLGPGVRRYVRELELSVSIVVDSAGADDRGAAMADAIDDIAEEVEDWFFAREANPPVWVQAVLERVEGGIADEAKRPTAGQVLTFAITYHDTAPRISASPLDDLTRIDVEQNLAPADADIDARDEITVPTQ